eukprot:TRINITY_DN8012_c0_g1_i1.p1 TRINITY_DN8012_c0_g1~~TRINITY_DN8012_c0_g1_i1.p1  ORF type:complete len:374 (+),score=71.49 TRINITY_DN8012_c0_g1_i1:374-1495(+)
MKEYLANIAVIVSRCPGPAALLGLYDRLKAAFPIFQHVFSIFGFGDAKDDVVLGQLEYWRAQFNNFPGGFPHLYVDDEKSLPKDVCQVLQDPSRDPLTIFRGVQKIITLRAQSCCCEPDAVRLGVEVLRKYIRSVIAVAVETKTDGMEITAEDIRESVRKGDEEFGRNATNVYVARSNQIAMDSESDREYVPSEVDESLDEDGQMRILEDIEADEAQEIDAVEKELKAVARKVIEKYGSCGGNLDAEEMWVGGSGLSRWHCHDPYHNKEIEEDDIYDEANISDADEYAAEEGDQARESVLTNITALEDMDRYGEWTFAEDDYGAPDYSIVGHDFDGVQDKIVQSSSNLVKACWIRQDIRDESNAVLRKARKRN